MASSSRLFCALQIPSCSDVCLTSFTEEEGGISSKKGDKSSPLFVYSCTSSSLHHIWGNPPSQDNKNDENSSTDSHISGERSCGVEDSLNIEKKLGPTFFEEEDSTFSRHFWKDYLRCYVSPQFSKAHKLGIDAADQFVYFHLNGICLVGISKYHRLMRMLRGEIPFPKKEEDEQTKLQSDEVLERKKHPRGGKKDEEEDGKFEAVEKCEKTEDSEDVEKHQKEAEKHPKESGETSDCEFVEEEENMTSVKVQEAQKNAGKGNFSFELKFTPLVSSNRVSGKRKRGATWVTEVSQIARSLLTGSSGECVCDFSFKACCPGRLLQYNQRLLEASPHSLSLLPEEDLWLIIIETKRKTQLKLRETLQSYADYRESKRRSEL